METPASRVESAFADIAAADEASVPASSAPPTPTAPPAVTVGASIEADAAGEGSPATGEKEVPAREPVLGDFGELCDMVKDRGGGGGGGRSGKGEGDGGIRTNATAGMLDKL